MDGLIVWLCIEHKFHKYIFSLRQNYDDDDDDNDYENDA